MTRQDRWKLSESSALFEVEGSEENGQFVACPVCGQRAMVRDADRGCVVECGDCGIEVFVEKTEDCLKSDVFEQAPGARTMFVVDGPIGCGKTRCIERVVAVDEVRPSVLWITLNDNLARYYASRNGLNCNLDPGFWDGAENLERACISMESLWIFRSNHMHRIWDTVVIDDCMFIMDNLFSPALSDNLGDITRAMSEAIRASTRSIVAGHAISQDCIDFFSEFSANMTIKQIKFIKPSHQQPAQCYYGEKGHHQLQSEILNFYDNNRTPFLIVANGPRLVEELYHWLYKSVQQRNTNNCSKIKLISEYLTSDPHWTEAFLCNPNDPAILQYCDVLVIDPSMKAGYSFGPHFTTSFEFLASNKLPPVYQLHLTARLRNITYTHKFTWKELEN
ncbi:hypothetical protein TRICI_001056 [Trichomonascus ciferrii]|uniref:Replication origin-binding protein domain-containing protein n=1 Tax=Trichomonascus ciferrii TaxID=44093 RepID=A0A642VAE7_9ASCO|nr:hypothetical protein TRICI_001056 [Trichomonascus ciferrii]